MGTTEVPQGEARPTIDDVQQEEYPLPALLVKHDGPLTAIELPALVGTITKESLTTSLMKVLYRDEKRKRAILVSSDAFLVSRKGAANSGAVWPANVPLELTSSDEVWAAHATATSTLTVITEVWAD